MRNENRHLRGWRFFFVQTVRFAVAGGASAPMLRCTRIGAEAPPTTARLTSPAASPASAPGCAGHLFIHEQPFRYRDTPHMAVCTDRVSNDINQVGRFIAQIYSSPDMGLHAHSCAVASPVFISIKEITEPIRTAITKRGCRRFASATSAQCIYLPDGQLYFCKRFDVEVALS